MLYLSQEVTKLSAPSLWKNVWRGDSRCNDLTMPDAWDISGESLTRLFRLDT